MSAGFSAQELGTTLVLGQRHRWDRVYECTRTGPRASAGVFVFMVFNVLSKCQTFLLLFYFSILLFLFDVFYVWLWRVCECHRGRTLPLLNPRSCFLAARGGFWMWTERCSQMLKRFRWTMGSCRESVDCPSPPLETAVCLCLLSPHVQNISNTHLCTAHYQRKNVVQQSETELWIKSFLNASVSRRMLLL